MKCLVKIDPLVDPGRKRSSVPPQTPWALEANNSAVLPPCARVVPEVLDATSVAASLVAWTDDPDAPQSFAIPGVSSLSASSAPDLYFPLKVHTVSLYDVLRLDLEPAYHSEVLRIEQHSPAC